MRESNTWRSVADNPGTRWELGKPSCRQWPFQRRFLVLVAERGGVCAWGSGVGEGRQEEVIGSGMLCGCGPPSSGKSGTVMNRDRHDGLDIARPQEECVVVGVSPARRYGGEGSNWRHRSLVMA